MLINGNGYAKFLKDGVYPPPPLQLGTWEYLTRDGENTISN